MQYSQDTNLDQKLIFGDYAQNRTLYSNQTESLAKLATHGLVNTKFKFLNSHAVEEVEKFLSLGRSQTTRHAVGLGLSPERCQSLTDHNFAAL